LLLSLGDEPRSSLGDLSGSRLLFLAFSTGLTWLVAFGALLASFSSWYLACSFI